MTETCFTSAQEAHEYLLENPDRLLMPNIVHDLGLYCGSLGLYMVLKNLCGEKESFCHPHATIHKELGDTKANYLKAVEELTKGYPLLGGKPLINVHTKKKSGGRGATVTIWIEDIWKENFEYSREKERNET